MKNNTHVHEIQKLANDIEKRKSELVQLEQTLERMKGNQMRRVRSHDCPVCQAPEVIRISGGLYHVQDHTSSMADSPRCQRRFSVGVRKVMDDDLQPGSLEWSISHSGYSYEDSKPNDLTDTQLQTVVDYLAEKARGRTRTDEIRFEQFLEEKTKRLKIGD